MAEGRSLGEAIRLRRLDLGMSQEELAEQIGPDVRQSDVSRLERGKIVFPRLERLNQIASALGLSVGALLTDAGWFTAEGTEYAPFLASSQPKPSVPIVVADDEPISLDAIVSLLEDYGCTACRAYDFQSLIEAIDQAAIELVIVDIALPGLKSDQLIDHIAKLAPPPILVFMGTGLSEIEGNEPYLEKPIDSRQLLAFISILDTRSSSHSDLHNGKHDSAPK